MVDLKFDTPKFKLYLVLDLSVIRVKVYNSIQKCTVNIQYKPIHAIDMNIRNQNVKHVYIIPCEEFSDTTFYSGSHSTVFCCKSLC